MATVRKTRARKKKKKRPLNPELQEILDEYTDCRRCELCKSRGRIVLGTGHPLAEVVIVGEAPGKDEDEIGRPFVGHAGRFLDELLPLPRKSCFITNAVCCRPPTKKGKNQPPKPDQLGACSERLHGMIEAIDPRLLITLGNVGMDAVFGVEKGIMKLRGYYRIFTPAMERHIYVALHPAAALYDKSDRSVEDLVRADWKHIAKLMKEVLPNVK